MSPTRLRLPRAQSPEPLHDEPRKETPTMATFDELKAKYAPVMTAIEEQGVRLQNLHEQDGKLFIRGAAPTEAGKNLVWMAIKSVDTSFADVMVDLTVDPSLPAPAPKAQTYTVEPGDTLSGIAKKVYGNGNKYMKIFQANTDILKNPDQIKPGQVLKIPADA